MATLTIKERLLQLNLSSSGDTIPADIINDIESDIFSILKNILCIERMNFIFFDYFYSPYSLDIYLKDLEVGVIKLSFNLDDSSTIISISHNNFNTSKLKFGYIPELKAGVNIIIDDRFNMQYGEVVYSFYIEDPIANIDSYLFDRKFLDFSIKFLKDYSFELNYIFKDEDDTQTLIKLDKEFYEFGEKQMLFLKLLNIYSKNNKNFIEIFNNFQKYENFYYNYSNINNFIETYLNYFNDKEDLKNRLTLIEISTF